MTLHRYAKQRDANEPVTEVLAIDPGFEKSAAIRMDLATQAVTVEGILLNDCLLAALPIMGRHGGTHLAIEMIASFGMPVGREVFETCVWIGRFLHAWPGVSTRVYRRDVKLHLCGNARAKDANVRQALLDRFGPGREKAIGTKNAPGPLYGVKRDLWAALAVAVTWADVRALELMGGDAA